MLAPSPPSSEWVPGGITGEIKAARERTDNSTSHAHWPKISFISSRHSTYVHSLYSLVSGPGRPSYGKARRFLLL